MKIFRLLLIVILLLTLAFACVSCTAYDEKNELAFVSNGDGTCLVSGIGNCTDTAVVIPSRSPAGDKVSKIGDYAFLHNASITSVVIPDSVTMIGNASFSYCTGLTSITISNSVKTFGNDAFYGCTALTSITFKGTIEQWKVINKGNNWDDNTGSYKVHCTDGDYNGSSDNGRTSNDDWDEISFGSL